VVITSLRDFLKWTEKPENDVRPQDKKKTVGGRFKPPTVFSQSIGEGYCLYIKEEVLVFWIGSNEPVDGVGDGVELFSPPLVALHGYHHGNFAIGGELDDIHALLAVDIDVDADIVLGGVPACHLETVEIVLITIVGSPGVDHIADSVLAVALSPGGVANLNLDVEGAAKGAHGAILLAVDIVDVEHDVVEVEVGGGAEVLDKIALGGGGQERDAVEAADDIGR